MFWHWSYASLKVVLSFFSYTSNFQKAVRRCRPKVCFLEQPECLVWPRSLTLGSPMYPSWIWWVPGAVAACFPNGLHCHFREEFSPTRVASSDTRPTEALLITPAWHFWHWFDWISRAPVAGCSPPGVYPRRKAESHSDHRASWLFRSGFSGTWSSKRAGGERSYLCYESWFQDPGYTLSTAWWSKCSTEAEWLMMVTQCHRLFVTCFAGRKSFRQRLGCMNVRSLKLKVIAQKTMNSWQYSDFRSHAFVMSHLNQTEPVNLYTNRQKEEDTFSGWIIQNVKQTMFFFKGATRPPNFYWNWEVWNKQCSAMEISNSPTSVILLFQKKLEIIFTIVNKKWKKNGF